MSSKNFGLQYVAWLSLIPSEYVANTEYIHISGVLGANQKLAMLCKILLHTL